jgi:hypothetical protein
LCPDAILTEGTDTVNGSISTFENLIAPVTSEAFFSENWESKSFHIHRSNRQFYKNLLTNHDLETTISSGGLRYPSINLAKCGKFFLLKLSQKNIRSGNDLFTGVPDLDVIRSWYRSGATLLLPGFQRAWKPVGELTTSLKSYFDRAAHTNAYITPGNADGFSPHNDPHEVFIIQLAGIKHWCIYEPALLLPHRTQPFTPHGCILPTTPILELELIPGDLLYLPRGMSIRRPRQRHSPLISRWVLQSTLGLIWLPKYSSHAKETYAFENLCRLVSQTMPIRKKS